MKHYIQVFGRKIELTDEQAAELNARFAPPETALTQVAVGETFMIGGHEFVVLEQMDGAVAVVLKELLYERMEFGSNNNFDGSGADKACREFADEISKIIGAENLVEHTVDLTSDDGLKDYGTIQRKVSLFTADLYRKYVEVLDQHKIDAWQWLATPSSTKRHENDRWVKCVSPSGYLLINYCDYGSFGVRPFCILKSDIFVSK